MFADAQLSLSISLTQLVSVYIQFIRTFYLNNYHDHYSISSICVYARFVKRVEMAEKQPQTFFDCSKDIHNLWNQCNFYAHSVVQGKMHKIGNYMSKTISAVAILLFAIHIEVLPVTELIRLQIVVNIYTKANEYMHFTQHDKELKMCARERTDKKKSINHD